VSSRIILERLEEIAERCGHVGVIDVHAGDGGARRRYALPDSGELTGVLGFVGQDLTAVMKIPQNPAGRVLLCGH